MKAFYTTANNDIAELQYQYLLTVTPVTTEVFRQGAFSKDGWIFGSFPQDKIQGRIAALNAVQDYGKALTDLIDAKAQNDQINGSVGKLTTSLKSIPGTTLRDADITTAQIDAAGQVLVAIAALYLDLKREQVLREVVPVTSPIVSRICTLLAADLNKDNPAGIASAYTNVIAGTAGSTGKQLKDNPADRQVRASAWPVYRKARIAQASATLLLKPLVEAADGCAKANDRLATSVADPKLALQDIESFSKNVQALIDAFQLLMK